MAKQQSIKFQVDADVFSDAGEPMYEVYEATRAYAAKVVRAARAAGAYIENNGARGFYIEPNFSGNARQFDEAI